MNDNTRRYKLISMALKTLNNDKSEEFPSNAEVNGVEQHSAEGKLIISTSTPNEGSDEGDLECSDSNEDKYFIPNEIDEEERSSKDSPTAVRVCHSFFRKTLNISASPIIKMFSDVNECGSYGGRGMRGKQMSVNKTPESSVEIVKEHIKKFPVVESHYCRQSSKRLYHNTNFSVAKMHDMYVEEQLKSDYEAHIERKNNATESKKAD
ncbi:hypothetical protein PR048_022091 [Dryococelus australis]|uniref:Uncharacterized protein n=1 Tax=Dryococelus australis TaxID=614101 RepID=A0ABQ9H008_9NEOP|nr:hypothetical protein PR048_022091 [Dryococelus australis]